MHVKARMTAFSGLLLALSVVCMALYHNETWIGKHFGCRNCWPMAAP